MRAVSRLGVLLSAGAIALAPATALAQEVPATTNSATTNTPSADSVGPKELQNFSLPGTVTKPADQPPPAQAAPAEQQPRSQVQSARPPTAEAPAENVAASGPPAQAPAQRRVETASTQPSKPPPTAVALRQSPPSSSVTVGLPKFDGGATEASAAAPAATFAPAPTSPGTLASQHSFPVVPWLLALIALILGGGFLFWRNRHREAFAGYGGPHVDRFTAPEPMPAPAPPRREPAPAPAPLAPTPAPPSAPVGIVSTRIRPWIEIGFKPVRCILDNDRVTVEFEIEMFNSGSAPARAVLVEASLFNAGPTQDQEIAAFFDNPVGEGERITVIPPLQRFALKTQVVVPREHVRAYEIGGRQVFVPLIAFNALYNWGGGEGQTSVGYLLGRDTKAAKLGPFRLDLGPRIFRGVAARLLPAGVRR